MPLTQSRTKNSKRNIFSGLVKQVLSILLPFLIRTIVIYTLGANYQGLSGLFTSILNVLNLSELGLSTAIVFALYKPIADGDDNLISALVNMLKRVYRVVGIIIVTIGLSLLPFLRFLISGDVPTGINIYILYLLYLLNSAISYWLFAYKTALLTAMQREDIVSNVFTFTTLASRIIQIVILLLFRNYYLFLVILPVGTIVNNFIVNYFAKKIYPNLSKRKDIPSDVKKNIYKQVGALIISRIADVARNSLDNIIISMYIGLTAVAIYDNYFYIFSGLRGFFLVVVTAIQASVGNSIAKESIEKNYNDYKKFTLMFAILSGLTSICLLCLYQPFMRIWMRSDSMMLTIGSVVLLSIYFYEINACNVPNLYFNGNGLYWDCKWWYIIEAVSNLLLNILLGYFLGIFGILLATVVTLFLFNFLPRHRLVFLKYFKVSRKEDLFSLALYALSTAVIGLVVFYMTSAIGHAGLVGFFVKAFFSLFLSSLFYLLIFSKTKTFKEAKTFVTNAFFR